MRVLIKRIAKLVVGLSLFAGAAAAEPVCVVSSQAKLRAGPSTRDKVTWVVGKYMPLQRVTNENGWSEVVDLRGQKHWVISRNVSSQQTCAVVRVRSATLHRGPGASAEQAEFKMADRYTPFRRIEREGTWVRLEDDYKGSYWTRESNLWMPVRRASVAF